MLNYTGTGKYLDFQKTKVYDNNGNNNSRLDPGETVNLTTTIKNIGGANFSNLITFIQTQDPYLTITDNSGYFGALTIDSIKENNNDPYIISVNPSCPHGHNAQFYLIAADGIFIDTFEFSLDVGMYDYLAWNPDITPNSGQTIHNTLSSLGYNGKHVASILSETQLDKYKSIFVCFGVYPNNYFTNAWSPEVTALIDYIHNGGRVYLEGGEVWVYDANNGGYNFGPIFGILGVEGGTNNMGPLVGQASTFTQGMHFNYNGANNSMDHIEPTTGFAIFKDESDEYICGIAYDAGDYHTVGTSFEFGGLVDGTGVSTKIILMDSIMHFFGIFPAGIEEPNVFLETRNSDLIAKIYPNPFKYNVTINTPSSKIQIYDISGKLVKTLDAPANNQSRTPNNCFFWDGTNDHGFKLSPGVYFIKLNLDKKKIIKRIVLIN